MKRRILYLQALFLLPLIISSQSITVPSTSNIYGAGHTVAPGPAGGGNGTLPVEIKIPPNTKFIAFPLISGQVSCCNGDNPNDPDGNPGNGTTLILDAFNGLSGLEFEAFTFLAGVFLNDNAPSNEAPETLDYSSGTSDLEYRPLLNQIFFIGDGATGNKEGAIQKFYIPDGATRLFLGIPDTYNSQFPGYYGDNTGAFEVRYLPVKELDFQVRKNNCEGTGEIFLVNVTEAFGVTTTFDWELDGTLLSSGSNSGLAINEPGTYFLTQSFSFPYTNETLQCMDSVNIELPRQAVTYDIKTSPAICYSNNGSVEIITDTSFNITIAVDNTLPVNSNIVSNLFPGAHELTLTFENVCETTENIVIPNEKCSVYIPNAISPNEDGINDQFQLYSSSTNQAMLELIEIFDRWGNKVFSQRNVPLVEFSFDPIRENNLSDGAVFTFQAKIVHENNEVEQLSGTFTILL